MGKREREAIELVAERFAVARRDTTMVARHMVAGEDVAVSVVRLKRRFGKPGRAAKVRLRFDRGALRFVADLRDAVGDCVPDGRTLIVTITAPIWLGSKTGRVLAEKIPARLGPGAGKVELRETICGNRIGVCVANGEASGKVIGFVHNPERGCADLLLRMASALIEAIGAASGDARGRAKPAIRRWLVIVSRDEGAEMGTYRKVYSQLAIHSGFARIFVVFADGGVEALAD